MNDISGGNVIESNNILTLLLLATNDNKSYFYKEYFPLDLFKIIYKDIWNFEKQLVAVKKDGARNIS